jgi:hypothetical protein
MILGGSPYCTDRKCQPSVKYIFRTEMFYRIMNGKTLCIRRIILTFIFNKHIGLKDVIALKGAAGKRQRRDTKQAQKNENVALGQIREL